MSNPQMGPDETITGLELLMKLSPKDQKRLVSKLLNKELPIDRGSNTQQKPSPASEEPPSS
jgi:beta-lactamase class D